jgi:hypothetical protein
MGRVRCCTGRFAGFNRPRTNVGITPANGIRYFDLFAVEYGEMPAFVEAGYFAPRTHRDCAIVGEGETLAGDFGTAEVKVLANRHVQQGARGARRTPPVVDVEAARRSSKPGRRDLPSELN